MNPRGEYDLKVGGKQYVLSLSHQTIMELERATGKGVMSLAWDGKAIQLPSYALVDIIFHCSKGHSREDIAAAIYAEGVAKVYPAVLEFLTLAIGGGAVGDAKKKSRK